MKTALTLLLTFALPLLACEEADEDLPGRKLAEAMEAMLKSMRSSVYQHRTEIDESTGTINCDCSSLVGYLLGRDFPEHLLAVDGDLAPWRSRPLAATFYQTIERAATHAHGPWRQVPRLLDARPGDLIVWRKPLAKLKKGSSTGHICVVAGKPEVDAEGRIRVRVIDSTNRPHTNDTRKANESGLGAGEIWFQVDQDGRPIAYWRRPDGKAVRSNPILVGRLQHASQASAKLNEADQALIGLSEKTAAEQANKRGLTWRVIHRDGTSISIPLKRANKKRLNAVIEQGKVLRLYRG